MKAIEIIVDPDGKEIGEKHNSPIPPNGAYSELYFFDTNNFPCSRQVAKKAHIHIYDSNGVLISSVWANI